MQPFQSANQKFNSDFEGNGALVRPPAASEASTRSSSPKPLLTTRWGTHCVGTPPTTPRKLSKGLDSFPEEVVFGAPEVVFGASEDDEFDDIDFGGSCFARETNNVQYVDIPDFLPPKDERRTYDGHAFGPGYSAVVSAPPGLFRRSPADFQARPPQELEQHMPATRQMSGWKSGPCQQLQQQQAERLSHPRQLSARDMIPIGAYLPATGQAPLDYGPFEPQGRIAQSPMLPGPMPGNFRGAGPISAPRGDFRGTGPIGNSRELVDDATRQLSLSDILSIFANVDTNTLIVVRRTYKLGFDAEQAVHRYFSQFGTVARVLLSHSALNKSTTSARRLSPSGLGFVQMESAAAVQFAVSLGPQQMIDNVLLRVQKFETRLPAHGASSHQAKTNFPKRWRADTTKRCRKLSA